MKNNQKLWGVLVHLSCDMWLGEQNEQPLKAVFDENMWNDIIEKTADSGMNTIVLDVGNGVRFFRHPEIAKEDAYSPEWVREQVEKCRKKGIALIPKLNFSTAHDYWLGDYCRMISSSVYYKVTKELIEDVYEIFCHPQYIHLGMDEEDAKHKNGEEYYWILFYSFLSPQQYRSVEIIIEQLEPHIKEISFRTYYRKRKEAIDAFSSILWGYTSRDSFEILDKFFPKDENGT